MRLGVVVVLACVLMLCAAAPNNTLSDCLKFAARFASNNCSTAPARSVGEVGSSQLNSI